MLRIKKEHIGKRIVKGSTEFLLSEEMTEKQILYIKNMISEDYVEEIEEIEIEVIVPKISIEKQNKTPRKRKK